MITLQQVNEKVRELAKERPDFRYRDQPGSGIECSYVAEVVGSTAGVGCIVGQALQALGIEEEVLRGYESEQGGALTVDGLWEQYLQRDGLVEAAPVRRREGYFELLPEMEWLAKVQAGQDVGRTWGEAVEIADMEAADLQLALSEKRL